MDSQPLFDELLRVAAALGVAVRVEPFETPAQGGGGSCLVRGERLIVIDLTAPLPVRIAALAKELSELETDAIFMLPDAREAVEAMRESQLGAAPAAGGAGAGGRDHRVIKRAPTTRATEEFRPLNSSRRCLHSY